MKRICLLFLTMALLGLGCTGRGPKPRPQVDLVEPRVDDKENNKGVVKVDPVMPPDVPKEVPKEVAPALPDQDAYEASLLKAVDFLAERRYKEALDALEDAQKAKDTGLVQREIDKVRASLAQQAGAEKAVSDVKTVLAEGNADDAARLANAALAQHGGGDQAQELARLKQQADAIINTTVEDSDSRVAKLTAEADAAEKQQNLRAAAVALEQATALKADATLTSRLDDVHERLKTYDDNRARAIEARKDPARFDEAMTRLQAARKVWDTLEVKQEIDEVTLVLERRRDRLSVTDFEVRGDVGVASIGRTVGEEMLGYFKPRFDLVERAQVARVIDELKLDASDLIDSREGGRSVARLAKVRYLVVGSITPLAGITVQARLVEVSTGLIVQTARISAPDLETLLPRLKQVAIVLQMTDAQKEAYEDRMQAASTVVPVQPIAATALVDLPPPPPLPIATAILPPPIITYTPVRPILGGLLMEDYRTLPVIALVPPPPPPALAISLTRNDPRRHRLLRLSLDLGDNLFRRRRYAEANRHFSLALSLGGPRRELTMRVDACRQFLPPPPPPTVVIQTPYTPPLEIGFPVLPPAVVVVPPPMFRPRVAVFGFNIYCRPGLIPPASSDVLADQFASYCGGTYAVIDRGEVCWFMGRLGLTMADLLRDPVNRRCLAQSLNARYLVFGTIQETASFNVETHLFDATTGDRTASAKIHVQDHAEMKLRLGELAKQIGANPADRAALVKQSTANEQSITQARSLIAKNEPAQAAAVARAALKSQPDNVALQSLAAEADRKQKLAAFDEARRKQQAGQAKAREDALKRQQELAKQSDLARQRAAAEAKSRDAAGRKQLLDQKESAAARLRQQAAAASKSGDPARAAQLLQSATSLAPSDATFRELAQAQVKAADIKRSTDAAEKQKRDAAIQAQQKAALARVEKEKETRGKVVADQLKAHQAQEKRIHDTYVKQSSSFLAKKDFTHALAAAEAAHMHQGSDESARLASQARLELAKIEAAKKGAAESARVEKEHKDREAAGAKLARDRAAYLAAIKNGHDAVLAKNYAEAASQYSTASKLFRTDAALTGLKTATDMQARERKAADDKRTAGAAAAKQSARMKDLITQGNTAIAKKDYTKAVNLFTEAKKIAPDNVDVLAGLGRAQRERDAAMIVKPVDKTAQVQIARQLAAGKASLAKNQFAAAATAFREVLKADAGNIEAKRLLAQAEKGLPVTKPPVTKPGDEDYKLAMSAGLAAYKKGNWTGAINSYIEALRLRPGDDSATAGLNQSRLGQKQAAYADWMKKGQAAVGLKKWADAVTAFDEALKARPGDAPASAAKRDALVSSKVPAIDPAMQAREAAYRKAMAAGQVARVAKKYVEAIKAYDDALKAKPGDAAAKADRQASMSGKEEMDRQVLVTAALKRKAYQAWMTQAQNAMNAKKYADAVKAYDEALKIMPGDATAIKGKRDATDAAKKPATPVTPPPPVANPQAEYAKAMQQGAALEGQKNWAGAVTAYQLALRWVPGAFNNNAALNTQQANAYRGLGRAEHAQKRYAEAVKAYDEVLKRVPTDANAKAALARAKANKP